MKTQLIVLFAIVSVTNTFRHRDPGLNSLGNHLDFDALLETAKVYLARESEHQVERSIHDFLRRVQVREQALGSEQTTADSDNLWNQFPEFLKERIRTVVDDSRVNLENQVRERTGSNFSV